MTGRKAIYPGSFDPITKGHLDLIKRALTMFEHVRIAVAHNPDKPSGLFTPAERCEMIQETVAEHGDRVSVDAFHGLLVSYAQKVGAGTIVRGLRAVADFDYEFQMTLMNRHLADDVETVFLMADKSHFYTSSSLVKEVCAFGGDITPFVPTLVAERLADKFSNTGS
jgi:pantetheine-phosphate adenylyltransferase